MSGQAAIQISRGALMAASAGAGSLYLYSNGMIPQGLVGDAVLRGLARAQATTAGSGGDGGGGYRDDAALSVLGQQLGELSKEVARLRLQAQYGAIGGGLGISWTTVVTVGGAGVLYMYIRGYGWADVMYVTKRGLEIAVESLQQGIETVGVALEATKRELSYKLGLLENKMDDTKNSLEQQITREVGEVKREVSSVGNDVRALSRSQDRVHNMMEGMETQIDAIEFKMENANVALSTANRGIYLLCNVVAENMVSTAKGTASSARQGGSSLYEELVAYTRSAMNSLSSRSGGSASNQNVEPAQLLPSPNQGLKLIEARNCTESARGPATAGLSSRSIVDEMLGTTASLRFMRSASSGTDSSATSNQ